MPRRKLQPPFSDRWMFSLFVAFITLLGFIDWITGPEIHFFVFYLLPISTATWYYQKRWGYLTSIVCILLWFQVNPIPHSVWWYSYWNAAIRLINFIIIVEFVSRVRNGILNEIKLNEQLQSTIDEIHKKSEHIDQLQKQIQTVCAWTHRIKDEGKWISFEEYLEKHFHMKFSHGISEEALKKTLQELHDERPLTQQSFGPQN